MDECDKKLKDEIRNEVRHIVNTFSKNPEKWNPQRLEQEVTQLVSKAFPSASDSEKKILVITGIRYVKGKHPNSDC